MKRKKRKEKKGKGKKERKRKENGKENILRIYLRSRDMCT